MSKGGGNMLMIYLLLALSLVFIRISAGYDSRYQKGKYFSIKNSVFARIILGSTSIFSKTKRRKGDRNKITVCGVCLYFALAAVVIVNVLFLIIPDIPCEQWMIDTSRFIVFANTLNDKVSAISILLLFLATVACIALACISEAKVIKQKWLKAFCFIFAALLILMAVSVAAWLLYDLISGLL